jgi:hypothetical protein
MIKIALILELAGACLIVYSVNRYFGNNATYLAAGVLAVILGFAIEQTEK